MKRPGLAILLLGLATAIPAQAQVLQPGPKADLELGISTSEIAVRSNFAGADITVFGAIKHANPMTLALGQYDVVVTLEGPRMEATVRKKQRVFGIWINRYSVDFLPIPTSYSLSSTRPIDLIATQQELRQKAIGIDNLRLPPSSAAGGETDVDEFRKALLRIKQQDDLYRSDSQGVQFVSTTLFKASIRLPASIPVGTHVVHGYLFKNGEFVAEKTLPLHVVKTGIEQYVNTVSKNDAFLYGVFAVFLAGFSGWIGSVIFRKD